MSLLHIIDTHALLWFLAGDPRLGAGAKAAVQDPASMLVLPATALAIADVLNAIDSDPRITIYPLDRAVIERSNALTTIGEMHDRQIVATALLLQEAGDTVLLVTKDSNITASAVVPVLW